MPAFPTLEILSLVEPVSACPCSDSINDCPKVVFPVFVVNGDRASDLLLSIICPAVAVPANSAYPSIAFCPLPKASDSLNVVSWASSKAPFSANPAIAKPPRAATTGAKAPNIGRIIEAIITGIIRSCDIFPIGPGIMEPAITAPLATIPIIPPDMPVLPGVASCDLLDTNLPSGPRCLWLLGSPSSLPGITLPKLNLPTLAVPPRFIAFTLLLERTTSPG